MRKIIYLFIVAIASLTLFFTPVAAQVPVTPLPTPINSPLKEQFSSILNAQAKLLLRIREFYGGKGAYRGSLAIFILSIGPLKIIPGFLRLTAHADEKLRRQLAVRAFILSSFSVLFAALFGENFLVKYNIPLTAIIASAGILLFLVALRIVLSQYGHDEPPEPPPENPSLKLVVQPLVFPIILTPYGIAIVITLSALAQQLNGDMRRLLLTLMGIMVVNLLAMLFARQIVRILKNQMLQVLGLVLGVIQLSLGLGLIFSAIELQALVIKELVTR